LDLFHQYYDASLMWCNTTLLGMEFVVFWRQYCCHVQVQAVQEESITKVLVMRVTKVYIHTMLHTYLHPYWWCTISVFTARVSLHPTPY